MTSKAEGGSPRPVANAPLPDPAALGRSMADIAERSQRIVLDWQRRQASLTPETSDADDRSGHAHAFLEMTARLMASPVSVLQAQIGFWQDYMTLWQHTTRRMLGGGAETRSGAAGWRDDDVVDFIKQSYLLSARTMQRAARGVDRRTAQRLDYYARQFIGAMSPASFLLTNTRVLRRTVESGGENLLRGLNTLLADLEHGRAHLAAPETARFRLGETIGATAGAVIAQNAVMQLIQYAPATDLVARRPLLIVPPWINKFYVLDLQPQNSFVRWAVSQGHTVFMISWVDPQGDAAELGFEDYLRLGIFAALETIAAGTGETQIDTLGYCLGGTLLAAASAIDGGGPGPARIASMTLLATMLDYGEAGTLGVFIDEAQLDTPGAGAGRDAAGLLRSSDLIWSFVVNTFALGNDPFPFDLLHWNADQTRLPSSLHRFYLERIYRRNELASPGALSLLGQAVDLRRITAPTYILAARDDHIAPWRSVYRSTQMVGGPARFVLTGSGHSGGVVNPPGSGRHNHWVGDVLTPGGVEWFAAATEIGGSWWPDWHRWVAGRDLVRARTPSVCLEAAPGSYVRPVTL